ncbi:hypothetical protein AGLY_003952 [Aphis glycines]|uniref:Uncharacterized protein n=1 Tax=Aphis glycines TaxID=307491 RepID=A0A6G0TZ46_APHGL|nr:hypothetical protein AGLY_003952 [Aphis glycines]
MVNRSVSTLRHKNDCFKHALISSAKIESKCVHIQNFFKFKITGYQIQNHFNKPKHFSSISSLFTTVECPNSMIFSVRVCQYLTSSCESQLKPLLNGWVSTCLLFCNQSSYLRPPLSVCILIIQSINLKRNVRSGLMMYVSRWEIITLKIKYPYLDYEYSQGKAEAEHLPPPLEFKI